MNDYKQLEIITEIGYLLLRHGAEIYRVEESLKRMCEGLGYQNIEVFAIPTYFTLSLDLHDGTHYHTSKRSRSNRIHLDHLYELNNLVRKISHNDITLSEVKEQLEDIRSSELNLKLVLFGYVISAPMFCIFFGGAMSDMFISAVIGFILYYVIFLMEKLKVNSIVSTIISSIVLATIAIFAHKLLLVVNLQATITGCLMLLVPGIAITNSLRDIIGGDFISGLSRMIEAILIAASIAIGVGVMMMLLGGVA